MYIPSCLLRAITAIDILNIFVVVYRTDLIYLTLGKQWTKYIGILGIVEFDFKNHIFDQFRKLGDMIEISPH